MLNIQGEQLLVDFRGRRYRLASVIAVAMLHLDLRFDLSCLDFDNLELAVVFKLLCSCFFLTPDLFTPRLVDFPDIFARVLDYLVIQRLDLQISQGLHLLH